MASASSIVRSRVNRSDRLQGIAANVVGSIVAKRSISVRGKNGRIVVIHDEPRGSGKNPGERTYRPSNPTGEDNRRFPEYDDMLQGSLDMLYGIRKAWQRGRKLFKLARKGRKSAIMAENPYNENDEKSLHRAWATGRSGGRIFNGQLANMVRWYLFSTIRSNGRKEDVSRKYADKKTKENPYFNPEGVRESFATASRELLTNPESWDTLTQSERTAVMLYSKGFTLEKIADDIGANHPMVAFRLLASVGRKLTPKPIDTPPEPGAWVEPTRTKPVQQGRTTPYQLSQG